MEPDGGSREELSSFLAKVDEVESLVSDLRTSSEPVDTEKALQKADEYLGKLEKGTEERVIHNRTVINTGIDQQSPETTSESSAHFLKTLEDDAKERGERRRERETEGSRHKRSGNMSFRSGQYATAVEQFSEALRHTPWDTSLYTNRALAYNCLGHYNNAIADCDAAIKLEPCILKAYLQKAKALTLMHRVEEAEQCYSKAQELFPHKADFISGLQRDRGT